jgi:beta-1,2-mannobiose phosphorylase / 1,2-beta-oligomannan phosphorylase
MNIIRNKRNPLITPADVSPSRPDFKVDCTMNAAVTKFKKETLLLIRVAESVISDNPDIIKIPLTEEKNGKWKIVIKEFNKKDENYDFSDSRIIKSKLDSSEIYLTSLSHFRLAKSRDGVNFEIEETSFLFPDTKYETFGIEDPRITLIEGRYYINYTAVSSIGVTTALAVTDDFNKVERLGVIFGPDNKDMCIFPEKVCGKYYALHRPTPKDIGTPDMWLAKSDNLIYWGDHNHFLGASNDEWDSYKLGGGSQVIKTDRGWLEIYHGVDMDERYCLGAVLMDLDDPVKIIAKSKVPLLEPETDYEVYGFFGNVVFTCGALIENDILRIYYGAADEVMALAEISLVDLWKHLDMN